MKWTYDGRADALYVHLRSGAVAHQEVIDDRGVVMDVTDDGSPIGLEVVAPIAGFDVDEIAGRFRLEEDEVTFLRTVYQAFAELHRSARTSNVNLVRVDVGAVP